MTGFSLQIYNNVKSIHPKLFMVPPLTKRKVLQLAASFIILFLGKPYTIFQGAITRASNAIRQYNPYLIYLQQSISQPCP